MYQFTEKSVKVIEDLLEGETPTVGFNRNENGVDATFLIDFTVEDVAEPSPGNIQRKRSTAAIEDLIGCFSELAAALK